MIELEALPGGLGMRVRGFGREHVDDTEALAEIRAAFDAHWLLKLEVEDFGDDDQRITAGGHVVGVGEHLHVGQQRAGRIDGTWNART